MTKFRLTPEVDSDLEDIADYIIRDNPERALSFVDEVVAKFRVIGERPESFPLVEGMPWPLRSALHGNYRILFEIIDDLPHILRVIHGARDIDSLF